MPPKNSKRLMADHGDKQSHAGHFSGTVKSNYNDPPNTSQQNSEYHHATSSNDSGRNTGVGSSTSQYSTSPPRGLKRHRSLATMRTTVPTSEGINIASSGEINSGSLSAAAAAAAATQQHHTFAVSSISNQTSRPIRQRIAIACRYCRRRKIKCHGFDPNLENSKCVNCIRFNQECIFTPVSSVAAPVRAIHQHGGALSMSIPQPGIHDVVSVPQRRAASLSTYYWRHPVPVSTLMTTDQAQQQHLAQEHLHQHHQHHQPPPPPPPLSQHHHQPSQPLMQHLPPQVPGGHQIHPHHHHGHGIPSQLGDIGGNLLPPMATGPGTHRIYLPPSHQPPLSPAMVGVSIPAPTNVQHQHQHSHQHQHHQQQQVQQVQHQQQVHQLPVVSTGAPSLFLPATLTESRPALNVATAGTSAVTVVPAPVGSSEKTPGHAPSAAESLSTTAAQGTISSAAGDSGDDPAKSRPRRLNIKDLVD